MTREHLEACRHLFREVPQWVEQEADKRTVESRNMAEREVIGRSESTAATGGVYGEYGKGFDITAPATDAARQWQGWGTALKPALEPITVARKPFAGTVAENVLAHGTGALNIDGCRVSDAGRWPANLIHDGSDEVLAAFPQTPRAESAARFFYCAKAGKSDRGIGNSHPTVKPTDLMRHLCRLVTPPGGLVLDPFAGSGSTGKAAAIEGFKFLGFEKDPQYAEIARARIIDATVNT